MPSRRQFLTTAGVGATVVTGGCLGSTVSDDAPGPDHPPGTLWVYNTARSDLSVTVTTVEHSPEATFERVVESGDIETQSEFVSAPAGTTVRLRARVESFAEEWLPFSFMPNGDGETPPQYARLHIPGADGDVGWQSREASE